MARLLQGGLPCVSLDELVQLWQISVAFGREPSRPPFTLSLSQQLCFCALVSPYTCLHIVYERLATSVTHPHLHQRCQTQLPPPSPLVCVDSTGVR